MTAAGLMPHDASVAPAVVLPASHVGVPAAAPIVLRNVSAYRFWLTFISRTARTASGGERYVITGVAVIRDGASWMSSTSTAAPRTSIPFAINEVLSAFTKKIVPLSTEATRVTGMLPAGTDPRSSRRELPGSRCAAIVLATPAGTVVTMLSTRSPLAAGDTETDAKSPAAAPGPTVTRMAFSLNCSADTPAA